MKQPVCFRVIVAEPLLGVTMMVQRGKAELLSAVSSSSKELIFEFEIDVDISGDSPNFLGKYAQGPKDARFVYVNSGTYAGVHHSCWGRRAKLSLMSITSDQVNEVIDSGGVFETTFPGVGRDGGPTCASVKGLVWKVVKK